MCARYIQNHHVAHGNSASGAEQSGTESLLFLPSWDLTSRGETNIMTSVKLVTQGKGQGTKAVSSGASGITSSRASGKANYISAKARTVNGIGQNK